MKAHKINLGTLLMIKAGLLLVGCSSPAQNISLANDVPVMSTKQNTDELQQQAASQVYTYAYPLLTTYLTGKDLRYKSQPLDTFESIINFTTPPTYEFVGVVRANIDTLYSNAWFDLSSSPAVIEVTEPIDQYFLIQVLDGYSNAIQYMGTPLKQKNPKAILIQEGYPIDSLIQSYINRGYQLIRCPTSLGWILIRTSTVGGLVATNIAQQKYLFKPLYPQKIPAKAIMPSSGLPVYEQIANMPPSQLLALLAKLLVNNPPSEEDKHTGILQQLSRLGIKAGNPNVESANWSLDAIQKGFASANTNIINWQNTNVAKQANWESNGWFTSISKKTAKYEIDYLMRAYYSYAGFGANSVDQAIYSLSFTDSDGKRYKSSETYMVHFPAGQLPPVNEKGFWSLTLYNGSSFFAYNSELSKDQQIYAINSYSKYVLNPDGSLDICIQRKKPQDNNGACKLSNWLPAPTNPQFKGLIADQFSIMLRLYWPSYSVDELADHWTPPVVKVVK
jgi:hypothetical protein